MILRQTNTTQNVFIAFRNSGKCGKKPLPVVPGEFVNLVHVTLYKLVGANLIPKELVGPEFFAKVKTRFQNSSKKVNPKNGGLSYNPK